jgi:hypothetical protein
VLVLSAMELSTNIFRVSDILTKTIIKKLRLKYIIALIAAMLSLLIVCENSM